MEESLWRLLIDFGLVVLIWMVQLIVYPSFQHYTAENLKTWHDTYSKRISIIVIPLMLAQLFLYILYLINDPNIYSISGTILISAAWLITFLYFVPAHQRISRGETAGVVKNLATINWWRTLLWSLVFFLGLIQTLVINQ